MGRYEFNTLEEYEAGERDAARILLLEKIGTTYTEIMWNYRAQILNNRIQFESQVGEDFLNELERHGVEAPIIEDNFVLEQPQKIEKIRRVKPRKNVDYRKMILVPLCTMLFLTNMILVLHFYNLIRGTRSLDELRNEMAKADAVYAAEEIAVEENAVMTKFQKLYAKNNDFAGWLIIPGTDIDYPVMHKENDNDFYLNHNFKKDEDPNGSLVLDKRCSTDDFGQNSLIHGHNMKSGEMFGSLNKYTKKEYFEEHSTILYSTLYEEKAYEIFAVFRSSVYDENSSDLNYYDYINIESEEQFNSYIKEVKANALYNTGVDVEYGDKLITLSTCEYSKKNGRLVIVGREKR